MGDESRIPRYRAPKGELIERVFDQKMMVFRAVHNSGSGPGLLLVTGSNSLSQQMCSRATLFAEEGYSVLAISGNASEGDLIKATEYLEKLPETELGLVAVGYGKGASLICGLSENGAFKGIVCFDSEELIKSPELLDQVPCPIVCHFGGCNRDRHLEDPKTLQSKFKRKDGSRIYIWEEGAPGFADPEKANFNPRADDLAHTRTLELIRRVVGPYYDFVSLFAEHVYHEFTTKDVDATMATMIEEPYVNHVPTLAGGVGHDMLKRFYKYHFVDQNAGGRDRTRISYTMGPNRVVLETYTKFRHDSVIDRYFPGIEPTGKEVEIATVIIVKFRGDQVCHEHLYWDQGSALKQIGVLDAGNLPLAGPEAARKVLDETLPSNIFMGEAWETSEGKPL